MKTANLDPELVLKATPPRAPTTAIARERLLPSNGELIDKRMLLLRAPAGYGKTTLLMLWRKHALQRGSVCVWLKLDERDQPRRFARGLQTALAIGGGKVLATRVPWFAHEQDSETIEDLTRWLAQVSLLSTEVVLMLDDLHLADHGVAQECVSYLVLNAPANLTIIASSQKESTGLGSLLPAHEGKVGLLDASDLVFTRQEAEDMLHGLLGRRIDAAWSSRAFEVTEGWPLGLQILASMARSSRDALEEFNRAPSTIRGFDQYVDSFVIPLLQPGDLEFLVRASLSDRLTPSLCEVLTGRADSFLVLERLSYDTPLFDQTLHTPWTRLHKLAREYFLRRANRELDKSEYLALHRRATEWFAGHGMEEHAAQHAMAAGMHELCYEYLERCMPAILGRGDLEGAQEWLGGIPTAKLLSRPELAIAAASVFSYLPKREAECERLVQAAVRDADENSPLRLQAAAVRMNVALRHDQGEEVRALIEGWASQVGKGCPSLDVLLTMARCMEAIYRGDGAHARYLWRDLAALPGPYADFVRICRVLTLSESYLWEGNPRPAVQLLQRLLDSLESSFGRRSSVATGCAARLAWANWDLGNVSEASKLLVDRVDILERIPMYIPVFAGFIIAARVSLHEGDQPRALSLLSQLALLGEKRNLPRHCIESLSEQIRLHACARRPGLCTEALVKLEAINSEPNVKANGYCTDYREIVLFVARAYERIAHEDYEAALVHIESGLLLATKIKLGRRRLTLLLLQALARRRTGRAGSDSSLQEALSVADAYHLRNIASDVHPDVKDLMPLPRSEQDILKPTASDKSNRDSASLTRSPKVIDSHLLTPREQDVLHSLALSMPNKRIATSLGIGEETVKWHVKNLLEKLGGANRKHVVDRARQLGIVS